MTNSEILARVKILLKITDTSQDDLLNTLILMAEDKALVTIYPFVEDLTVLTLPTKYGWWVVQAAKQMYDNLGSESISRYKENGLEIDFVETTNGISYSLLTQLIPKAKVVG